MEKEAGKNVALKDGAEFDFDAAEKEDQEREERRKEREAEEGEGGRRRWDYNVYQYLQRTFYLDYKGIIKEW